MAHNHLGIFRIKTAELNGLARYKHMAGTVETIAADAVFLEVLMWNGVEICLLRHLHTECSIPYRYVGLAGHSLLAGLDSH